MRYSHLRAAAIIFAFMGGSPAEADQAAETPQAKPEPVEIRLQTAANGHRFIEISGLPAAALETFAAAADRGAIWERLLLVHVQPAVNSDPRPPLLGTYTFEKGLLRFLPRFPLEAGLTYRVTVRPAALGDATDLREPAKPIVQTVMLAKLDTKPTLVEAVYPTRDRLPENQLKFYLHFSAPMSRGDSYRHLRLLREDGTAVDLPFLELGEELWNDAGTRLTVFFDPGRIKRGLKPREEVGPSLEAGRSYTLVIDEAWLDAAGRPLAKPHRKAFQVVAADNFQPATTRWTVTPPKGSRAPLAVEFDEPLDHAMLYRVLSVYDAAGHRIAGDIVVSDEETRWQFRPRAPWRSGEYRIVVEATLEDLAGNSLGRPFEVDVFDAVERSVPRQRVTIPFGVSAPD